MSKKQHQRQVAKARAKRQASKYDRRATRNKIIVIMMAVLMVLSVVGGALALLFEDGTEPAAEPPPEDVDPFAEPAADEADAGPCPTAADQEVPPATEETYTEPPRYDLDEDATYVAIVDTTCGEISLELDTAGAPRTAENFLALAEDGFYDGVPFHRIVNGFMIQGGDPTGTGGGGPGYQIEDELETAEAFEPSEQMPGGVLYPRGTLAMVNSGPDTQGSQFFVVQGDPSDLGPDYTVFGQAIEGMDVVDDIAAGPVGGPRMDEATDPVFILGVTIEQR